VCVCDHETSCDEEAIACAGLQCQRKLKNVCMLTGIGGVEAAPAGDPVHGIATFSATVSSY
jgi:hypothetical protein